MLRIALVDDDREHLRTMRSYLETYSEQEHMPFFAAEFQDGLSFVEDYDGSFDIVFLDIEMPHLDGLEAARRIRAVDASVGIIFITNMAQYAIHGYEVQAIPVTTKENRAYHGFGVRSIQYIVDKYKGDMLMRAGEHQFLVDILFYVL